MKPEHTHIYFWKMPFSFRHSSPWQNFSDQEAGWLCSKVKHHISESWSCISQRQCRMELLECHASTAGTLPWLQWPGMAFPAAAGTFSTMHRAACMGWKGKGMFVFGETLQRKLVPRSVSKTNAEVMNLYACLLQKTQLYSPCICHTHTQLQDYSWWEGNVPVQYMHRGAGRSERWQNWTRFSWGAAGGEDTATPPLGDRMQEWAALCAQDGWHTSREVPQLQLRKNEDKCKAKDINHLQNL